jgi:hypothetical protein
MMPMGIHPVVRSTRSGVVAPSAAGEAPAPRLQRGRAAEVKPRCDPKDFARRRREAAQKAEALRQQRKGR